MSNNIFRNVWRINDYELRINNLIELVKNYMERWVKNIVFKKHTYFCLNEECPPNVKYLCEDEKTKSIKILINEWSKLKK